MPIGAALEATGIRLFWLDGNHEDHTRWADWLDTASHPRVQYLPRGHRWTWWDRTCRGNWTPDILLAAQRHRDKLAQICRSTHPARLFHGHYHIPYVGTLDCGDSSRRPSADWPTTIRRWPNTPLVLTRDGL
ncbi:MAG: hypothetical protein QOJ80_4005 [Mycobacterium sp.]|nr:hypothetical protein [Mycobacterium sp.]